MLRDALLDEALSDSKNDGGEGLSLCVAVLQEAINDYLLSGNTLNQAPEPKIELIHCSCDPICPIDAYWIDGIDFGITKFAQCERMRLIRALDEYPAEAWLTSRSERPWTYRWVCEQFPVNSEWLLDRIRRLPRGKPLQVDGKRLYRHSRGSYDSQSQQQKRAAKESGALDQERDEIVRAAGALGRDANIMDIF